MKKEDVQFIFQSYQILERKFLEILNIFPLTKENEKAFSPELTNLFLDICGLIDSISRHIIGSGASDTTKVHLKNGTSKKIKNLTIQDFEDNLFNNIQLLNSLVVVYVYPGKILNPYQCYRNRNGWWKIYNSLKHNRIINYRKANIKNTLNSLAALFLLLIRYKQEKEFTKALIRKNFLDSDYVPEIIHSKRNTSKANNFWYDSKLFGAPELPKNLTVNKIDKINLIYTSDKFKLFFGRAN